MNTQTKVALAVGASVRPRTLAELPRMYQDYPGWSVKPDFEVLESIAELEKARLPPMKNCHPRLGLSQIRGKDMVCKMKDHLRERGNSIHVPQDRDARRPCRVEVLKRSHELLNKPDDGWGQTHLSNLEPTLAPEQQVSWRTDSTRILLAFAALLYKIVLLEGPEKRKVAKPAPVLGYVQAPYQPPVAQMQPHQQAHPGQFMLALQPEPAPQQANAGFPMAPGMHLYDVTRPPRPMHYGQQIEPVQMMFRGGQMQPGVQQTPLPPPQQMHYGQQIEPVQMMFRGGQMQPGVQQTPLPPPQQMHWGLPPQGEPSGPQHRQVTASELPLSLQRDPMISGWDEMGDDWLQGAGNEMGVDWGPEPSWLPREQPPVMQQLMLRQ